MKSRIYIKKIWSDDDVVELKIEVVNGESIFSNKVYVGYNQLKELVKDLSTFSKHIHGGLYDIKFGEFGPEYANGAFQARPVLLDNFIAELKSLDLNNSPEAELECI